MQSYHTLRKTSAGHVPMTPAPSICRSWVNAAKESRLWWKYASGIWPASVALEYAKSSIRRNLGS